MADSTTNITQIATSQAQKEVTANGLFDAASVIMLGARRAEACVGTVWGYFGGRVHGNQVANGTIALDPSTTSYIVMNRSTGAIGLADASPWDWADTGNFARLYVVVTGQLTVTSYEDHRLGAGGLFSVSPGADDGGLDLTFAMGTLAIVNGGTGSTTASAARTALGVAIGTDVQAFDADLSALADLTSAANKVPYFTGSHTAGLLTLDTDGTLAANSDTVLATQKAVKSYVDSLAASADAMIFKGVIDCSANPNYPAADRGWTYRVSVAGKIGGASGINVENGDILLCMTDSTASGNQATVGAQWAIAQTNVDGAYYAGGTDVAVNDGGTGASTASGARTNLGLVIGTDVQAFDTDLSTLAGLTATTDNFIQSKSSAWSSRTPAQVAADLSSLIKPTESLILACSDETTALTSGTAKLTIRMPYAFTVSAVRASLTTAQSSGSIFTVDINEAGTTILSTKLTIDNTEKTSTTAATAAVISDTSLADDAEITIDIDQVGNGTATGLKVVLIGTRT